MIRATAKLHTIPIFEKVLRRPEAVPYACGGAELITALLFAGKNELLPTPFKMAPKMTKVNELFIPSVE